MRSKLFIWSGSAVLLLACFAFMGDHNSVAKSDGGPPYNTNAPLDKTCSGSEGSSPCHSGGIADNAGPGTPAILFSGGSVYVPGQTYTVTAKVTHPTRNRFGFQIVSLSDNNNMFAGSITLLDTNVTRWQQPTWGSGTDRVYVMHRLAGSYPTIPNTGQWSYTWTAPSTSVGNISFYACFLAANNNNVNDSGDECYWAKITIAPSAVGIQKANEPILHCTVFPNPASEYLQLNYTFDTPGMLNVDLIDVSGNVVQRMVHSVFAPSAFSQRVTLNGDIAKGVYFIRSCFDGQTSLHKVQIL